MPEGTRARRWRLELAWDGRAYVGWQRQPGGQSIQQVVEEALSVVLGGEAVKVQASGRTDAGVHAHQQIVAFDAAVEREPHQLVGGLNARLPLDITVLKASLAPPDFDPRRWVQHKRYRYRILARTTRCPFREGRVWHHKQPLDLEPMQEAVAFLVGRHDFSAFRARGCTAHNPVRDLWGAAVVADGDELHFDFAGHGFLRHQVRIMVGSLVEVGTGRWPVERLVEVLASGDRTKAGRTAPARGLWLMEVEMGTGPYWDRTVAEDWGSEVLHP